MNQRQLELFIRQAFAMEEASAAVIKATNPAFIKAMSRVREIVGQLPDKSLMRELIWRREIMPQIQVVLQPYNDELATAVLNGMVEAAPEMQAAAIEGLKSIVPPGQILQGAEVMPLAESTQMALRSNLVTGKRLNDLFGPTDAGVSQWMKSNLRVIDKKVKMGILKGEPTADIADGIAKKMNTDWRSGFSQLNFRGKSAAREIRGWANSIARTGIRDMQRQVDESVWKANPVSKKFKFEWVAALDARTCPVCAPLDGKVRNTRAQFPDWPVHWNCRCSVVLIDPDETQDVRTGIAVAPPTAKGKRPPGFKKGDKGVYSSKVKVDGKWYYRKTEQIKAGPYQRRPTYGDYLNQSDRTTQAAFFGTGNAGSVRAERFRQMTKSGLPPDAALNKLIVNAPGTTGKLKTINPAKVRFKHYENLGPWPPDDYRD